MQDEYKIPVIIGSGRTTKSPFGPLSAAGGFTPAGLIGEALELAVADAGAGDEIYQSIDAWGSPQFTTGGETNNVPWLVAKKYGITLREGRDCHQGQGSSGQLYMCHYASEIAAGTETGVVILASGEARHSLKLLRRQGQDSFPHDEDAPSGPSGLRITNGTGVVRVHEETMSEQERAHGLTAANWCYPVYDNAMRGQEGRSIADHQLRIGGLFSKYSEVASAHAEHSWFPQARTAEEIADPDSDGNRMIGFPYTKFMCAFNDVYVQQRSA